MKTVNKNNNTNWYEAVYDFFGCVKTINVNGEKIKLVYDMIDFNRANREHNSDYDLVIDGVKIGHVYYDLATAMYVSTAFLLILKKPPLNMRTVSRIARTKNRNQKILLKRKPNPLLKLKRSAKISRF